MHFLQLNTVAESQKSEDGSSTGSNGKEKRKKKYMIIHVPEHLPRRDDETRHLPHRDFKIHLRELEHPLEYPRYPSRATTATSPVHGASTSCAIIGVWMGVQPRYRHLRVSFASCGRGGSISKGSKSRYLCGC